jgi:hypothetical protein
MGDFEMSVSALGSPRAPRLPVTPANHRPGRAEATAERHGTDFDHLTGADRELIFRATGQRIGPGFDPAKETTTGFAASLAAERAAGRLAPGQPVTAVYLKDLNRRYQRAAGPNPVAPYLDKAVAYLSSTGDRRIDVSA